MNESPSMLEWGIFKMEKDFSTVRFEDIDPYLDTSITASYDWDADELRISILIYPSWEILELHGRKTLCRKAVSYIKSHFGYEYKDTDYNFNRISSYFEHDAFVKKNQPERFARDIEKMTRINASVHSSKTGKVPFHRQAACTSKFLEKELYFVDDE